MHAPTAKQGFSTVELLIALFIAAAFLGTAYRLFSVVMNDSNEARARSRAGNVAYEHIRSNSYKITNPCTTTPSPDITTPTDLPEVTVAVAFSCPYGATSRTTRITTTVTYGPQHTVVEESIDVYR